MITFATKIRYETPVILPKTKLTCRNHSFVCFTVNIAGQIGDMCTLTKLD